MPAELEWQNRGINDTDILSAKNFELSVDNTAILAWEHAGSADRVVVGAIWMRVSDMLEVSVCSTQNSYSLR